MDKMLAIVALLTSGFGQLLEQAPFRSLLQIQLVALVNQEFDLLIGEHRTSYTGGCLKTAVLLQQKLRFSNRTEFSGIPLFAYIVY
jgi:hypothetical protein